MAINYLIEEALLTPGGRFWYVAPTYSQAKMIAWRELTKHLQRLPPELIKKKNESELYVEIGNGSLIELKGADKEDSLRGVGLHGVVLDEFATIKPNVFDEIIRPALSDHRGWAIFISTPKGYNHFWEYYKRGEDKEYPDWVNFKHTSFENPHVPNDEIEEARKELGDDLFAQEYMAEFTRMEGLVYKEWDRKYHLIPEDWKPAPGSMIYRTIDFGAHNPTACLFIHVNNDGEVYIFDEYFMTEQTTEFHAGQVLSRFPEYTTINTFGDPAGKQNILDYASFGLHISPAIKEHAGDHGWVNSGIAELRQLMKVNPQNGRPRLFVTENCVNLIREIESYAWESKPKQTTQALKDVPVKVDDHCVDALRYFAVSYRPASRAKQRRRRKQPSRLRNPHTGY